MDANIHHQIQVSNHCRGVAPEATAREIDKGMFIIATLNQAFQFSLTFFISKWVFIIKLLRSIYYTKGVHSSNNGLFVKKKYLDYLSSGVEIHDNTQFLRIS
jgi:hypothetical protein